MRAWEIEPGILRAPIIDIGSGKGPLNFPGIVCWDIEQGDATHMMGVLGESFLTVYSHHCLEHLDDPITGLRNWWRILKKGGYLVITVPHRDFYEKRSTLPSIFNPDHKTMWLLDRSEQPHTLSLIGTMKAAVPEAYLITLRLCRDGYVELPRNQQSPDGFHAEGIWLKR